MNRTMEINCFELNFNVLSIHWTQILYRTSLHSSENHNEKSLKNSRWKYIKKIILLFWKKTTMKKSTFLHSSVTLLDDNILFSSICWFLHGPAVYKAGLNLIGEGINLFWIKHKEGFKLVWPKHTSWISHGAVKLTSFQICSFPRGNRPIQF